MVYRSRNKIMIQIEAIVPDDAEHFHGAEIEDFDRSTGMALLYVDADDIDYKIVPHQEWDTTEFHGNIATTPHNWLEVISCYWNGYPIINDEDVCYEIYTD